MKTKSAQFEPFFFSEIEHVFRQNIDNKSYDELVDDFVLKMGVDFSHPAIIALCQRLNFNVTIRDHKIGVAHEILEQGVSQATFCRDGEHYFVLYSHAQPPRTIEVRHQIPSGRNLFIRGDKGGLNWGKGIPLILTADDRWVYRSRTPLPAGTEYKFLLDDTTWEEGGNRTLGRMDPPAPHFLNLPALSLRPQSQTRITAHFPALEGQQLFIRGTGPGMGWDRGVALRHVGSDIWTFDLEGEFRPFEYKILLKDSIWEQGNNHSTQSGKKEDSEPKF
jgi:hypothetical protein